MSMKKIFSAGYTETAFNIATLILRVGTGGLMIHHGYGKLMHFSEMQDKFMSFLGMEPAVSLSLAIFAELVCSILLIAGFMTRLVVIPPLITMIVAVAVAVAHSFDIFGKGELPALYFVTYIALLLLGPGRYSIDGLISG
jgi:putative oxidoreductase